MLEIVSESADFDVDISEDEETTEPPKHKRVSQSRLETEHIVKEPTSQAHILPLSQDEPQIVSDESSDGSSTSDEPEDVVCFSLYLWSHISPSCTFHRRQSVQSDKFVFNVSHCLD